MDNLTAKCILFINFVSLWYTFLKLLQFQICWNENTNKFKKKKKEKTMSKQH